jgi:hypothetical protein
VSGIQEAGNVYRILIGKPLEERLIGRLRRWKHKLR